MLQMPLRQKALGCWVTGMVSAAHCNKKATTLSFGYTGEMATLLDASHSSSHGTEYADQFAFGTHFDLDKILGWQDTEAPNHHYPNAMGVHSLKHPML